MTGKLVIAVDAIRRGRGGPFVAAAIAFRTQTAEPLFQYTDGRGVLRREFLFRKPHAVKPAHARALTNYVRRSALAVSPFCLAKEKAPASAHVARLIAMFWAVKRLSDRVEHLHLPDLGDIAPNELKMLVEGPSILSSARFTLIRQVAMPRENDWRLQAACLYASHSFSKLS